MSFYHERIIIFRESSHVPNFVCFLSSASATDGTSMFCAAASTPLFILIVAAITPLPPAYIPPFPYNDSIIITFFFPLPFPFVPPIVHIIIPDIAPLSLSLSDAL